MIITTTHQIVDYKIDRYLGLVNANQVIGANLIADFMASFSDVFGGNSGAYRDRLDNLYNDIKDSITQKATKMGANAILGVHIDFDEISGKDKSMFMVTAYGTAVIISPEGEKQKSLEGEKQKKSERYEVYQKLYNLLKFKEAGVITNEQYEAERNNIILSHEKSIEKELEDVKTENEKIEAVKKAEMLAQQLAEQKEKEIQEALQRQAEEARKKMTAQELEAEQRRALRPELDEAYKDFLSKSANTIVSVRHLLSSNIPSPLEKLQRLSYDDMMRASYDNANINKSNSTAYNIGLLLKNGQVAEACKYYINLMGDENVEYSYYYAEEAKSYVKGIYEMLTFKDQKAFDKMAKNLVELKYLGKIDEAVNEFANYALCDKDIAGMVIELL